MALWIHSNRKASEINFGHHNAGKGILTLSLWKGFKKFPPISPSSLGVPGWLLRLILLGEFCKQDLENKALLKILISLLYCSVSKMKPTAASLRTKQTYNSNLRIYNSSTVHSSSLFTPWQVLILSQMEIKKQPPPPPNNPPQLSS